MTQIVDHVSHIVMYRLISGRIVINDTTGIICNGWTRDIAIVPIKVRQRVIYEDQIVFQHIPNWLRKIYSDDSSIKLGNLPSYGTLQLLVPKSNPYIFLKDVDNIIFFVKLRVKKLVTEHPKESNLYCSQTISKFIAKKQNKISKSKWNWSRSDLIKHPHLG